MEEILIKYEEGISELKEILMNLQEMIGDQEIRKDLRDDFINFNREYQGYLSAIDKEEWEQVSEKTKGIGVYGLKTSQDIEKSNFSTEIKEQAKNLGNSSRNLRKLIEQTPLVTYSLSKENLAGVDGQARDFRTLKKQIEQISQSHLAFDERIKKLLGENEYRALTIEDKLKTIEERYTKKISEIDQLYEIELHNIDEKKKQLDVVLGEVSSRVIAQDYETSAGKEMQAANWLRYASLFCMFLIVSLVGYSFWYSTQTSFNLESSIFRIVLAFLLSVPAAYLARESTKHREKQYAYLQTSLDLKAISPYLASLPADMQNQIKVDIANRIFGAKESGFQITESYPVNTHELIMELIKKIEINKGK